MLDVRGRPSTADSGDGSTRVLPTRVLLVSASMGAGHDGAARALATQLQAEGHHAEVRDFLESGPLRIGSALRRGYEFELKHVPSAYDATYRLWYRAPWLCPLVAWLVTVLTRRRVLRWIQSSRADVVVSTYPLATLCLGRLRAKGRLSVPVVNFITDFGVHPLWVHRGIDLNLAVHDGPASVAGARTGKPSVACGPVISPSFTPDRLPDRARARDAIGLRPDQRAVLIVAGSWGVGDVEATWGAIARDGRFTPVLVCGRDQHLQARATALASSDGVDALILGWTDDMPALMAACDVLVENAGGLTSFEAMKAGLPVVSFHPIAGHGKENTAQMAGARVSRLAADAAGLAEALAGLSVPGPERREQVARARAIFRANASGLILHEAERAAASLPPAPVRGRRRVAVAAARLAAVLAGLTGLAWAGLTSGVAMATEAGAGVAHPAPGSGAVVYVAVRLDESELADPAVVSAIHGLGVTALVDGSTAVADPAAVRDLAAAGVDVENAGLGDSKLSRSADQDLPPWSRARGDARAGAQIGRIIDRPVTLTVPGRRLTAWDLFACRHAHLSLVVPNHILDPARAGALIHLTAHRIYMVNGLDATPQQLIACLSELHSSLGAAHLEAASFAALT